MKEVVNLKRAPGGVGVEFYRVESLTNRLKPEVGDKLTTAEVQVLIDEAKRESRLPNGRAITINVKG